MFIYPSIHITRIWWMLALESCNALLLRFIPSNLPQTPFFLSVNSVYIFTAYCLCVYILRMNLYECFCVAMFHHLNPCISIHFHVFVNVWMIFIGWKMRIDTLLFSTAPVVLSFASVVYDSEFFRIHSDECWHIQTGFPKSTYGMNFLFVFIRKFAKQRLVLDYSFTFAW